VEGMIEIKLKRNWDSGIVPPPCSGEGFFIGRIKEIDLLKHEILSKDQGAILITGHRGVGKTSTVYKVLSDIKEKLKDKVLIVLINSAQLEAESDTAQHSKISPERILQNLIRRLYAELREYNIEKQIKDKIAVLYKKALAKEFKLEEVYLTESKIQQEIEKESRRDILLSEANIKTIIFIVCWTIAVFLQFTKLIPRDTLNSLFVLLFALPIPYIFNILYKKVERKVTKSSTEVRADEIYAFDNSIGNLEFDLEEIHALLRKKGIKLIYIIDELDKLDVEQVLGILKFFKHLFTLSEAIFIFIGGEEIFNKFRGVPVKGIYRSKEYTHFNSIYFLTRPMWNDLNKYFDEIMESKNCDDRTFEIIKHDFAFEAENDFFELKRVIRGKITEFDQNGNPVVKINEPEWDGYIKAFRLHKALSVLFEDKYMSDSFLKWDENERILRRLFTHCKNIYNAYSGSEIQDVAEDVIEVSAIRDLNGLLYRLGTFNILNETQQTIRGLNVPIRTYQYLGSLPTDPPSRLDEPSEIEKRFITEFERYCNFIISLNNVFRTQQNVEDINLEEFLKNPTPYVQQINDWEFDAISLFNTQHPVYNNLITQKPPYPYRRENIEQRTNQISTHINTLQSRLPIMLSKMLVILHQHLNLQFQNLQQNGNLFSGSAQQIRTQFQQINPVVVFKLDLSKQILLINNQIDPIKQLSRAISDNSKTHRVITFIPQKEDLSIEGLLQIEHNSPEVLFSSASEVLSEINQFLRD
jgi:Cdc6-like AAA superfamily ATPase